MTVPVADVRFVEIRHATSVPERRRDRQTCLVRARKQAVAPHRSPQEALRYPPVPVSFRTGNNPAPHDVPRLVRFAFVVVGVARATVGATGQSIYTGHGKEPLRLQCRNCGDVVDPQRVELGYDYCLKQECQQRCMKRVRLAAIGVNKAADYYARAEEMSVPSLPRSANIGRLRREP